MIGSRLEGAMVLLLHVYFLSQPSHTANTLKGVLKMQEMLLYSENVQSWAIHQEMGLVLERVGARKREPIVQGYKTTT